MLTDRWWSTYGTLALAAFSGYGYVVGVTAISRLSSALGVSTQDLGIGTRDYVTLAAIYGAAVAIALTLSIAFVISYATYAANMTRLRELVTQMGDKSDVLDHLPSPFVSPPSWAPALFHFLSLSSSPRCSRLAPLNCTSSDGSES
jgi:hypothetical protein